MDRWGQHSLLIGDLLGGDFAIHEERAVGYEQTKTRTSVTIVAINASSMNQSSHPNPARVK
jgi:hypothetical protein